MLGDSRRRDASGGLARARLSRVYGTLLVLIGLCLMFLLLAAESRQLGPNRLDHRLLLLLRAAADDPLGPPWFEKLWVNWTALGSGAVVMLVVSGVAGYLLLERQWRSAVWIVLAALGATLLSALLKVFYDRPRPDLVQHLVEVTSMSFPSGHSLLAASVYPTLGAVVAQLSRRRRVKFYVMAAALTLMVLIGVSRVYLGVHYPTDVLAGWVVGLGWALVCHLITSKLQRRGAIEES